MMYNLMCSFHNLIDSFWMFYTVWYLQIYVGLILVLVLVYIMLRRHVRQYKKGTKGIPLVPFSWAHVGACVSVSCELLEDSSATCQGCLTTSFVSVASP